MDRIRQLGNELRETNAAEYAVEEDMVDYDEIGRQQLISLDRRLQIWIEGINTCSNSMKRS